MQLKNNKKKQHCSLQRSIDTQREKSQSLRFSFTFSEGRGATRAFFVSGIERIITRIPCIREMKWRTCPRARFYPSLCRLHPSTGDCTHERPRTNAHLQLSLTSRLPY